MRQKGQCTIHSPLKGAVYHPLTVKKPLDQGFNSLPWTHSLFMSLFTSPWRTVMLGAWLAAILNFWTNRPEEIQADVIE